MRYNTLQQSSIRLSELGFGASPFGNIYQTHLSDEDANNCVSYAIDHGINYFDVAPYYGNGLAEQRLGTALLPYRDKAIISTKVGRYGKNHFDFSATRIRDSIENSLCCFNRDYIDIVFCHDIEFVDQAIITETAIPTLVKLKHEGKLRHIGISGHPLDILLSVSASPDVDVVLSYDHYHLLDQSLDTYIPKFRANTVSVINASPFAMGLLTSKGPPEWHPATQVQREAADKFKESASDSPKSLEQHAFEFVIKHPNVVSTLTGFSTQLELQQCLFWLNQLLHN